MVPKVMVTKIKYWDFWPYRGLCHSKETISIDKGLCEAEDLGILFVCHQNDSNTKRTASATA